MIKRPVDKKIKPKSVVAPEQQVAEQDEQQLRPLSLKDYIGQEAVKDHARLLLDSAKVRQQPMDHVLIHGAPGLGKTTLATIFAKELASQLRVTAGPALEKSGDLAALLSSLQPHDILFIDEIHRMRPQVEEILYSAMEDFVLDLMVGKGPTAKSMRLAIPPFTLIGATTKPNMLSSPLRDRFGSLLKLEYYTEAEIAAIIGRSAAVLEFEITEAAAIKLSKCARRTPRIANRLLKRVRDYCVVEGKTAIDEADIVETLNIVGIDPLGVTRLDQQFLATIKQNFQGGPVGLSAIAAAMQEDADTLAEITEPFLMQLGFLQRTHRGRIITESAQKYLLTI